jgi:hypothetical protein
MTAKQDELFSEEASAAFHDMRTALKHFNALLELRSELTPEQQQMKGEFEAIFQIIGQRVGDNYDDAYVIPLMTAAARILLALNCNLIDGVAKSVEVPDFPEEDV